MGLKNYKHKEIKMNKMLDFSGDIIGMQIEEMLKSR